MIALLATAFKCLLPIAALGGLGTGVYYGYQAYQVSQTTGPGPLTNQKDKDVVKPVQQDAVDFTYLLVKATAPAAQQASSGTTSNDGLVCSLKQSTGLSLAEKACYLYKLNSSTTSVDSIDLKADMFSDSQQVTSSDPFASTGFYVLKLTKKLYSQFVVESSSSTNDILVVKQGKVLGTLNKISVFDSKWAEEGVNAKTSLFLARVKTKGAAATNGLTSPLNCKISSALSIPCKLYKADDSKNKTNSLTKAELSKLSALTAADTDLADGNYVVVDLSGHQIARSSLTKNEIEIFNSQGTADANKVGVFLFDQILFGKVGTTVGQSQIFPLTPTFVDYFVSKDAGGNFSDINGASGSKNYICEFTDGATVKSYDHSCTVSAFPSTPTTIISFEKVKAKAGLETIDSTKLTASNNFVLTIDKTKLFNLNPDWTTPAKVVAVKSTANTNTQNFTLIHQIKDGVAVGNTNLALVKYKSKEAINGTPNPTAGNCAFSEADATGFACSFKKTTGVTGTNYESVTISTDQTDFSSVQETDHFMLVATTTKNIEEFKRKKLLYYSTTPSNNKITFDIISLVGGDNTSSPSKPLYFLESPRSIA